MKLNNTKCKNAKPRIKPYKMFDGAGLYLEILPSGKKLWRLKYYYLSKEKRISFGPYPLVTLAEAREAREDAKKLLIKDIDPSAARKDKKRLNSRDAENTFKAIALEWHGQKKNGWSKNYAYKVLRGLELNVFPFIGHRPISKITPPELLNECLRKPEKRGSLDIASRTRQICGQIFQYGIQTGRCEWNAAENLKGALKTHKKEHYRTISYKDIPAFVKSLERNEARLFERTRRAVWFSLLVFGRPQEIRHARWEDIDFEEKKWIVPAEYMKTKREHLVPLSGQAIAILKEQKEEVEMLNSPWVFPSQVKHRNPMSDGTVNKAIQRLGFGKEMVAHGFRALARTTIREKLKYHSEVIEKQISHKSSGPLGEAYDRTQFEEERINMMQDWADYIDELVNSENILHGKFKQRA